MNGKMIIRIKKPNQTEVLTGILLWMPFLNALLTELLGAPRSIIYLCDVAWICLLGFLILPRKYTNGRLDGMSAWIICFFMYSLLTYAILYQSGLYFLWGVRNNFRFYIAFLSAACFWSRERVDAFFRLLDAVFWINFIVSLIQFFAFGIDGDYLGGVFGAQNGANGYSTIFMAIVLTKSVVFYLEKKESGKKCCLKYAMAIVLAAMAELKFFFVILAAIVGMSSLLTRFSWRKLILILGAVLGISIGTLMLTSLFGGIENWFSVNWLLKTASSDHGYTSAGDLNRLNAIPQINELWLKTGWQRAFGLGLGNCDTASYAILNTPFFEAYGNMHYTWISYAMIYLEMGWIGLAFYWGFFVLVYFRIRRIEKHSEGITLSYCRIARTMAILCVGISIYNSSLRTEAGYMAYFVLAVPFAANNRYARKCGNDQKITKTNPVS